MQNKVNYEKKIDADVEEIVRLKKQIRINRLEYILNI